MTTPRWRGTLIYTGTLAAMGAVAVTRFGPLAASDAAAPSAAGAAAVAGAATSSGPPSGTSSAPSPDGSGTASATPSPAAPSPAETATPAPGSSTSATVTVAGAVAPTRYGPVQVAVTFTGSQIVDVQTLQAPSDHHESAQISQRSTPILAQEVLAAQSASIDTVSGATYTSEAYRESVQSAIDQRG